MAQHEADSWDAEGDGEMIMEFYSACDCCDALMHKMCAGEGYKLMADGDTLCLPCVGNRQDFMLIP